MPEIGEVGDKLSPVAGPTCVKGARKSNASWICRDRHALDHDFDRPATDIGDELDLVSAAACRQFIPVADFLLGADLESRSAPADASCRRFFRSARSADRSSRSRVCGRSVLLRNRRRWAAGRLHCIDLLLRDGRAVKAHLERRFRGAHLEGADAPHIRAADDLAVGEADHHLDAAHLVEVARR